MGYNVSVATPGVGEDIESTCNKCGGVVWHVVVAKVGDKIAKVQCKRCMSQHRLRTTDPAAKSATKTSPAKAGPRAKAAKKSPAAPVLPEAAFDPAVPPRPYRASERWEVGHRVQHPSFGVGVVTRSGTDGKIEVRFPTEMRTLAQARPTSTLERPALRTETPSGPSDAPPRKV